MKRINEFIRIWLPLAVIGITISTAIAALLHIPLIKGITAGGFTAALVLSGFFFRAYGRRDDEESKQGNGSKSNWE
jgi:hypothetical protein